ncbi:hypothetical protein J1N35_025005 [Gossypium stocksii]|uniref:Uncharacterized protein n=1 Tax=Gossypium stocksii TaxID=47602 RepID=A0A9D3ZWR4_9ROSI|nr:hypothetical protein J1N35_025005 [Gossypium stocksii]
MSDYDEDSSGEKYLFKIVIIGDFTVGKSNLLSRYTCNEFNPYSKATNGVEFQTQSTGIDSKEVKAQIWNIASQERFCAITSAYYKGAISAFIVYDISCRTTFDSVSHWLDKIKSFIGVYYVSILSMTKRWKQDLTKTVSYDPIKTPSIERSKASDLQRHQQCSNHPSLG